MSLAEQFFNLFVGLDRAHGQFKITNSEGQKVKGKALTILKPPTIELWGLHLAGKQGLGIIPICSDNNCKWGAIDIDDYTLDLNVLDETLVKHKIPCVLCRTKSGGGHLYFFLSQPHPAAEIRKKLDEIAALLGFPDVEIFPKQASLANENDVGNWINMPYFDHERTVRYAIHNGKSLSAQEFLDIAERAKIDPKDFVDLQIAVEGDLADGPPCLQHYCRSGFPRGTMNNGLFSMGVYARMKYGDDWEEWVEHYNVKYMGPGKSSEVQNIIKALKKKSYFYKCNDTPLKEVCNKQLCSRRQYGIGGDESGINFVLGTLTKIDSDPPVWFIDVDGHRLQLTTDDLLDQKKFRKICVEKIHKLPQLIKNKYWDKIVAERLEGIEIIEAPEDASPYGQFLQLLYEFFARPAGDSRESLLLGKYWIDENTGMYIFRSTDLISFLDQRRFKDYKPRDVWSKLKDLGAVHDQFHIKGKCVQYWGLQDTVINQQTEEFDLPENKDIPF